MNTKQHNLNPVEHTFCVSGLLGLPSQRRVDRAEKDYLGQDSFQVMDTTAGRLGNHGLDAVIPSFAITA